MDSIERLLPHIHRRGTEVAVLLGLVVALQIAAGVGLSYVAGFGSVWSAIRHFRWPWLPVMAGALLVSFVGYYYAYQGIYAVESGPELSRRQMIAVVTAGFGGFLAHGGGALDNYALRSSGSDRRDAAVRVAALAGLEHGILGFVGCGAGIAVLALGLSAPPADFSVPWAVIPVPGTALAFVLAARHRERFRDAGGWRGKLGIFLDSIHLIRNLLLGPRRYGLVTAGMTVFWLADAFAAWAALALFGFTMNGASLILGFATGMVFTRRTGPLAGAGILMVVLPVTIWYSGAPLATTVVAIFAYRVVSVWLPMPFSLASMTTLRVMGEGHPPEPESTGEPSLRPDD